MEWDARLPDVKMLKLRAGGGEEGAVVSASYSDNSDFLPVAECQDIQLPPPKSADMLQTLPSSLPLPRAEHGWIIFLKVFSLLLSGINGKNPYFVQVSIHFAKFFFSTKNLNILSWLEKTCLCTPGIWKIISPWFGGSWPLLSPLWPGSEVCQKLPPLLRVWPTCPECEPIYNYLITRARPESQCGLPDPISLANDDDDDITSQQSRLYSRYQCHRCTQGSVLFLNFLLISDIRCFKFTRN